MVASDMGTDEETQDKTDEPESAKAPASPFFWGNPDLVIEDDDGAPA